MSAKYTFLAWDTPIDNAPLKLALLQLADNSDENGFSYYSISKMANSCGMSERTFIRKIAELEKMGLLVVERRPNRPSLYTLVGDEMGVTLCHQQRFEVTESHRRVTESHREGDRESHDPKRTPNNTPESKKIFEQENLLEDGFEIFYSAGLVKKSKKTAYDKFKLLCRNMRADPIELGELLARDIKQRFAIQQFGIDKLHPSTYLNQQRWEDEKIDNRQHAQAGGRQSAAERIAARNAAKYGQQSCGLGMAEGGRDIRGAMDKGERREPFSNVDTSFEQIEYIDGEAWGSGDNQ